MRILFGSPPGVGHLQPMLPLAVKLRHRGHEVVWVTGADGCDWVRSADIHAIPVGPTTRERFAEYMRRWPEAASLRGEERSEHMFPRLFAAVGAPPVFPPALQLAKQWRPDIVVSDAADFAWPAV